MLMLTKKKLNVNNSLPVNVSSDLDILTRKGLTLIPSTNKFRLLGDFFLGIEYFSALQI